MKFRRYRSQFLNENFGGGLWQTTDGRFCLIRPALRDDHVRERYWRLYPHDDSPSRDEDRSLLIQFGLICPFFVAAPEDGVNFPTRRAALEALEATIYATGAPI